MKNENYTQLQKQIINCIASAILFDAFRNQLENFKQVSNMLYKSKNDNHNEDFNLYDAGHESISTAFYLLLTDSEKETIYDEDKPWDDIFSIFCSYENSFSYSDLLTDSRANYKVAKKVLEDWENFMKGYRSAQESPKVEML